MNNGDWSIHVGAASSSRVRYQGHGDLRRDEQKVAVRTRREGIECGMEGHEPCICNSNFCCKAPDKVRDAFQTYHTEWQTGQGQIGKIICKYGVCNVTLDEAVVSGCRNLNCLNKACDAQIEECHLFSPQHCTSCRRCDCCLKKNIVSHATKAYFLLPSCLYTLPMPCQH